MNGKVTPAIEISGQLLKSQDGNLQRNTSVLTVQWKLWGFYQLNQGSKRQTSVELSPSEEQSLHTC